MSGKPRPKPCFLDRFEVWKVVSSRKVWRNDDGTRHYTWDSLHGEVEVFDRRGWHLGALDAITGRLVKQPEKGRKLNVR